MPFNRILIATGNAHKFREITGFLVGLPWKLLSLHDLPAVEAPDETGMSFEANALIKARAYSDRFGIPCIADDSGLAVDALGGAPGIYSARYAGAGCTDAENNKKLLEAMQDVSDASRGARFVCCCVFLAPRRVHHLERGVVEGTVARAATGSNGFGYDPVFIPRGYDKSLGELTCDVKASIGHRGRALRKMREFLERVRA